MKTKTTPKRDAQLSRHPDARLLAQAAELTKLHRTAKRHHSEFCKIQWNVGDDPRAGDPWKAWADAVAAEKPLARAVMAARARTIDGVVAKLRIALLAADSPSDDGLALWVDPETWLPVAIKDLERLVKESRQ